jgi:esterase
MGYLEKFHYQISGDDSKAKLVFLHGLMGAGKNWSRIVNAFKDNYHILTYDQRGHGRSFQPKEGYHPRDYAEDLKNILDELQWQRVHLVGHSMGGRNAIQFAALYPERLLSLTVEDIGVFNDPADQGKIRKLIDLVPTPFESRKAAREFFQKTFEGLIPDNPQAKTLANYFYMNMSERDNGTTSWRFSKQGILKSVEEGRKRDMDTEWMSIKQPILLMRGQNSTDLSQENFDKMQSLNPFCKGVLIENSGHWIHFEQPELFIQTLKQFLAAQSPE